MDQSMLIEIEKLRRASLAVLRQKYREVFEEETQCRHRGHLFRRIAWRLQALLEGDLTQGPRRGPSKSAGDPALRTVPPRVFFTGGGARGETPPAEPTGP